MRIREQSVYYIQSYFIPTMWTVVVHEIVPDTDPARQIDVTAMKNSVTGEVRVIVSRQHKGFMSWISLTLAGAQVLIEWMQGKEMETIVQLPGFSILASRKVGGVLRVDYMSIVQTTRSRSLKQIFQAYQVDELISKLQNVIQKLIY